jgi:hypothetical protein
MRKSTLLFFSLMMSIGLIAQYAGTPWNGEPWEFGTTNTTNYAVGSSITSGTYTYAGVPHWAYDIGEVNLEIRCGADLEGQFVAGNGTGKTGTTGVDRRAEVGTDKTFAQSDIDARAEEAPSRSVLLAHNAEHRFQTGGAWARYTCTFDEGNYKLLFLGKSNTNGNFNFWVRFYDTDMEPLYPWGRYHVGTSAGEAQYRTSIIDVSTGDYTALTSPNANMFWVSLNDEFTLDGDVVVEISDPEPLSGYGSSGSGSPFGSFTFEYVGDASDKYAPQLSLDGTDPDTKLDDLDTLKLTITEDGTLFIAPKATEEANVEAEAIMSKALTAEEAWSILGTEMTVGDSVIVWSKDAAGNMRASDVIARIAMCSYVPRNDSIFITTSRTGAVYVVPDGTNKAIADFQTAVAGGTADSLNVKANTEAGLKIEGLADGLYMVYAVDTAISGISEAVPLAIAGGNPSSAHNVELGNISVYPTLVTDALHIATDESVAEVQIYNTMGALVHQQTNSSTVVDCSSLANGFYIVTIHTTADSYHTFKICKQ